MTSGSIASARAIARKPYLIEFMNTLAAPLQAAAE
jgi:hypothetical protein